MGNVSEQQHVNKKQIKHKTNERHELATAEQNDSKNFNVHRFRHHVIYAT